MSTIEYKRPRGRAPKGKVWNYNTGHWGDIDKANTTSPVVKEEEGPSYFYPNPPKGGEIKVFASIHEFFESVKDLSSKILTQLYEEYHQAGGALTKEEFLKIADQYI